MEIKLKLVASAAKVAKQVVSQGAVTLTKSQGKRSESGPQRQDFIFKLVYLLLQSVDVFQFYRSHR